MATPPLARVAVPIGHARSHCRLLALVTYIYPAAAASFPKLAHHPHLPCLQFYSVPAVKFQLRFATHLTLVGLHLWVIIGQEHPSALEAKSPHLEGNQLYRPSASEVSEQGHMTPRMQSAASGVAPSQPGMCSYSLALAHRRLGMLSVRIIPIVLAVLRPMHLTASS
jgi:hypothetical protein